MRSMMLVRPNTRRLKASVTRKMTNVAHKGGQCKLAAEYLCQLGGKGVHLAHGRVLFYLFLHEVRLGNCLTCQNNVPAEYAEKMLPPLTLQLLVENVIKHNSITPGKPMVITIRIEDEYLSVSNPIHPKKSVASSGIGLENLAKRCELMSGKKIIIKNETEKFTVKVPLLYE